VKEILQDVVDISRRCTHYGMCKTDFLPGGMCPPGKRYKFASYFPQGRMDIATALYEERLPVTDELVRIVESCQLCDICDRQCYFLNELRPLRVMTALDTYVKEHLAAGLPVITTASDALLDELADVVGRQWASNDPATLVAYSQIRSPLLEPQPPGYVVMPESVSEVAAIVKIARQHGVEVRPRGNGTSVGGALTPGIILDCARLRTIEINENNWSARVGAGVTALQLQRKASRRGLRANTAEPAANVVANVLSTNLHSLFSHSYGVGADNVIDAEFVTYDGDVINLNDPRAAQLLTFQDGAPPARPQAICTAMTVKLYPVPTDEGVLVVPFHNEAAAVEAAGQLSLRRIGAAVAVVGSEYTASFLSATESDAHVLERILRDDLGIEYVLLVVGDKFALDAVRSLWDVVIDQDTMRRLILGFQSLDEDGILGLLDEVSGDGPAYIELLHPDMLPILKMALQPSPEAATRSVDEDMRAFFTKLYARPEMTDIRWLMTFRIVSARIGRGRPFVSRIIWTPMNVELIANIGKDLGRIGDKHGLPNGFGYLVPLDLGKRSVMEYDYYFDKNDPAEKAAMQMVLAESDVIMAEYRDRYPGIIEGPDLSLQGLSRPESYLYR